MTWRAIPAGPAISTSVSLQSQCQLAPLPRGDLPNVARFREIISGMQIWKLPKIEKKQMKVWPDRYRAAIYAMQFCARTLVGWESPHFSWVKWRL